MDNNIKVELLIKVVNLIHNNWCMNELESFFLRGRKIMGESNNILLALECACYNNGVRRNELSLNIPYLISNSDYANECFKKFDVFLNLFNKQIIVVKKFTKRDLNNEEEMITLGDNYSDGYENILRPFDELSNLSKRENLEASIFALDVYINFCKVGISVRDMKSNLEIRRLIGIAIHTNWLSRNMDHYNESLKVSYDELDEFVKNQDLLVFDTLLDVVSKDIDKYSVKFDENYKLPLYLELERDLLSKRRKK